MQSTYVAASLSIPFCSVLTTSLQVPKRKPQFLKGKKKPQDPKSDIEPKKFNVFSARDSQAIELAYQELVEKTETGQKLPLSRRDFSSGSRRGRAISGESVPNTSIEAEEDDIQPSTRVPVNEDFLFDVDIENRELAPAYWLGPIYEGITSGHRLPSSGLLTTSSTTRKLVLPRRLNPASLRRELGGPTGRGE